MESRDPSAEAAATGVREVLVRDSMNDVRWLDLPCGPAVSCVTLRGVHRARGACGRRAGDQAARRADPRRPRCFHGDHEVAAAPVHHHPRRSR
ncbi:hypothetical protein CXR04_15960 [Streptomyces sp. CMB-StM0423]|nr:hypothetical protein CXR04_15960 [Streptomyces sp. CMB-StM0423]